MGRKFLVFFFISSVVLGYAQKISSIPELDKSKFDDLLSWHQDKKVVSFWASWCQPCMEELPLFSELKLRHPEVKVILVNLDFAKDVERKVLPIANETRYKDCEIVRVSGLDADEWIAQVNINWDGAIPATRMWMDKNDKFVLKKFTSYIDLENFLFDKH